MCATRPHAVAVHPILRACDAKPWPARTPIKVLGQLKFHCEVLRADAKWPFAGVLAAMP